MEHTIPRGLGDMSWQEENQVESVVLESHSDCSVESVTPTCPHTRSHSPSGVWLSLPLLVWVLMSSTSSLPSPPPHPPPLSFLPHTHAHTRCHPCFPSVTLYSADSSVACQKCWSLIATVRWDRLFGIEFPMTAVNYGAGVGCGSCLGTVLPLWGPADSKISSLTVNMHLAVRLGLIHPTQYYT